MQIKEFIELYETLCASGRAQCAEAKEALASIKAFFAENDLEFCSHNWAVFGSKRYAAELNPTLDRAVSIPEYRAAKKRHFAQESEGLFDFQKVDLKAAPRVAEFTTA